MASEVKLDFARIRMPARGVLVVFCDDALKLGAATRKILGKATDLVSRAAQALTDKAFVLFASAPVTGKYASIDADTRCSDMLRTKRQRPIACLGSFRETRQL